MVQNIPPGVFQLLELARVWNYSKTGVFTVPPLAQTLKRYRGRKSGKGEKLKWKSEGTKKKRMLKSKDDARQRVSHRTGCDTAVTAHLHAYWWPPSWRRLWLSSHTMERGRQLLMLPHQSMDSSHSKPSSQLSIRGSSKRCRIQHHRKA